jgi:tetratricopeptide (TPR) repeat protein
MNKDSSAAATTTTDCRQHHHHHHDHDHHCQDGETRDGGGGDSDDSNNEHTNNNKHSHQHASHDHSEEIALYNLPTSEKLEKADWYKTLGQAFFLEGQFQRASQAFLKIQVYLDYTFTTTNEEKLMEHELKFSSLLNRSLCALRLNNLKEAEIFATQALELKPGHVHALYIRGKARRCLGEYEMASSDISQCVEQKNLQTDDVDLTREVWQEFEMLKFAILCYEHRERTFAMSMFGSGSSSNNNNSNTLSSLSS